jgi:hypothetical protein
VAHVGVLQSVSSTVELARRQWEDGNRRVAGLTRGDAHPELHAQVEALLAELRRRVGGTFTLEELADEYRSAERWLYETLADDEERPGWSATATTALDAAFHVYSRSARDYRP